MLMKDRRNYVFWPGYNADRIHFYGCGRRRRACLGNTLSNAGGLGIITGLTQRTPEDLAKEIARCREMNLPVTLAMTVTPENLPHLGSVPLLHE